MNPKNTLPATIISLQILGIMYLWFEYKFGNSHIPIAFLLLNMLGIFSGIILIYLGFFILNLKKS